MSINARHIDLAEAVAIEILRDSADIIDRLGIAEHERAHVATALARVVMPPKTPSTWARARVREAVERAQASKAAELARQQGRDRAEGSKTR